MVHLKTEKLDYSNIAGKHIGLTEYLVQNSKRGGSERDVTFGFWIKPLKGLVSETYWPSQFSC